MTSFIIKMIAIVTMVIDHIGYFLVSPANPMYYTLRSIGRVSFVLFAFLVTEGLAHTRNKERYIATLIGSGFGLSLLWNLLAVDLPNVFYTLGFGALAIYLMQSTRNYILKITSVIAMCAIAEMLGSDYGAYGILIIVSIEVAKMLTNNVRILAIILGAVFYAIITDQSGQNSIQLYGLIAYVIMLFYNGRRGWYHPKYKYGFYVFYPVHLYLIYLVAIK